MHSGELAHPPSTADCPRPAARDGKRIVEGVLWLLLAALVVSLAIFRITDFDVWWHLKSGQYIITHRTVPTHDIFSYFAQGRTWIAHEWLFEVALFLVYQIAGLTGVIGFNSLIVLVAFTFTFLTLRRLKVDAAIGAPLVITAAFLVTFRAFARPHIVTEALLALYLMVLVSYKYIPSVRAGRKRLWWLLAVQLVWANTHSGMVLGVGLFVLFAVMELIQHELARRVKWCSRSTLEPEESRFLLGIAAALLAVSFLNPNFHRSLLYPFIITSEPVFSGGVKELQTPLLPIFRHADFFVCFMILLAAGVASFLLNWRRLELANLAVFVLPAAASLIALRNLPIFGLLAVPVIAVNLQTVVGSWRSAIRRTRLRIPHCALRIALLLVAAGLLVLVFARGVNVGSDVRKPAFGYDRRIFPAKAADFVARNRIQGNIFSTMEYGGYFIWRLYPEHQVFIDGRLDVYGPSMFETYGRMFWSAPVFDTMVQKYDITCCVLPQPPSNTAVTQNYIGRTLARRSDWSLVYWDDLALIYLRDVPSNRQLIGANAYQALLPILLGLPERADSSSPSFKLRQNERLLDEARRAVNENPASPLALTTLGIAYAQADRHADARQAFGQALAQDPNYSEALLALGVSYLQLQEFPKAIAPLERAVKLDPTNGFALYNLGATWFRNGDHARAEQCLVRAIQVNPQLLPAYHLLGDVYFANQLYGEARRAWLSALRIDPNNPATLSRLEKLKKPSAGNAGGR
jgi:Flp pilus assembly protein TadD